MIKKHQDGYILVTPIFTNLTYLINKEGFPVKKWESDDNALMAYLDSDGGIYIANAENSGGTFMVFNNNIDDNSSAIVEIQAPISSNGSYTMLPSQSTQPVNYI